MSRNKGCKIRFEAQTQHVADDGYKSIYKSLIYH